MFQRRGYDRFADRMLLAEENQWPEDAGAISATATKPTWPSISRL